MRDNDEDNPAGEGSLRWEIELLAVVVLVTFGGASGILLKMYGIYWPALTILLALLVIGLLTGQIRYKRADETTRRERRRGLAALAIFAGSMLAAFLLAALFA